MINNSANSLRDSFARPLQDLTIVEFGKSIKGTCTGYLFAEMGATVVTVESTNRKNESCDDEYCPDLSADSLENNKRRIILDFDRSNDLRTAIDICSDAHILLDSYPTGVIEEIGLGYSTLSILNPSIVFCSFSKPDGVIQTESNTYGAYTIKDPDWFKLLSKEHQFLAIRAGFSIVCAALASATGKGGLHLNIN